ncbi:transporter substrate-binding domain-containing protein [Oscillospiraceae bacterium LTW-04]|nr:transporter substrate-binding domain-containing protein [Oscillospiraceae bacterium MB24-C1]
MKKIICATLAAAMALALTACGGASSSVSTPASSEASAASSAAPAKETYIELTEDLGAEEYGVGFRNGDIAFGLEVQKYLDEMIADGTAAEISQKWFDTDALFKDKGFLEESEAPADDKSLESIKSKGKFIVGLDDSYPPMGFRDDKNEIVGFDIDLAREVAKRMGVEVEFQPIDWDSKELELNAGKIDCIWNGMTITSERVANMYFTKPYIANQQIIIVPASSGITTKTQLEGKIVGLQKGSSSLEALTSDPIGDKVKEIVEYPDNVSAYMDLQAGRIDVFVVDSVVGRYVIAQNAR